MINKNNNSGFTLLELVIVAAIIAILSLIALPSYKTYQARARRAEGLDLLSGYHVAAHSRRAEFGVFPGNLVQTDYQPIGRLGYRLQVADGTDIPIAHVDDACISTANALGCSCVGNTCPNFKKWSEGNPNMGVVGASIGPIAPIGGCAPLAAVSTTNNTFSARVAGVISLDSISRDVIGIDETKTIQICTDGSK